MASSRPDARSDERDPALEATRAVPLYQAQTVARPAVVDPALPATRIYSTGMLAQLVPALRTVPVPAAASPSPSPSPSHARAQVRWLGLSLALVLGAACGAAAVALLRPFASSAALAPPADPAPRVLSRPAARSNAERSQAPAPPPAHAHAPEHATRDVSRVAAPQGPAPTPRAAAELLARGRHREALAAYRSLAQVSPGQPAFARVAAVIAGRLARRCAQADSAAEAACTDEPP